MNQACHNAIYFRPKCFSEQSNFHKTKEEGRRKKEEGRRKKEEGRRKKDLVILISKVLLAALPQLIPIESFLAQHTNSMNSDRANDRT
ncbi:MAG: hypothetical protein EAZ09_20520 [Oscillatoriales cyanobacterium]|nr:MAG: hypothetical protein EAZ18_25055 [Oscillatoriales cyanobacterium]TAH17027.1 MAG: hypothetical protein EAZ09_20520 [Oscillatoriales cyanobacterium]